jgi:hypothetical protein
MYLCEEATYRNLKSFPDYFFFGGGVGVFNKWILGMPGSAESSHIWTETATLDPAAWPSEEAESTEMDGPKTTMVGLAAAFDDLGPMLGFFLNRNKIWRKNSRFILKLMLFFYLIITLVFEKKQNNFT